MYSAAASSLGWRRAGSGGDSADVTWSLAAGAEGELLAHGWTPTLHRRVLGGWEGGGDRAGAPWLKADLSTVLGSVGWYLSQQRWVRELLGGWRTAKRRGAAGGHGAKGQGGGNRAGLRHERGLEKIPSISSGSAHARRLLQSALKCKLRFSIRLEVNFDAKKTAHPHPCAQRRRRGLQGCIPGPPTPPGRWDGAEAAASPLAFCLLAPR